MSGTRWIIGVDVGGTFTDAILIGSNGKMTYSKVPTTPSDLSTGIVNSVAALAESVQQGQSELLRSVVKFAHGTTATVNALIQRRGARVGLITTKGFRDHLLIMRGGRATGVPPIEKVRFSQIRKPEPIIPFDLTEEVTERVDYKGRAIVPLDAEDAERAVKRLLKNKVDAICVSLLWSFKNPKHERKIKEIVKRLSPKTFVTLGSELFPVIGEYERTATAALNCYLSPILWRYVFNLQSKLGGSGFRKSFLLMQSTGGLLPGTDAPEQAATTLNSGLAGGVIASQYMGELLGCRNIITADMGGTSFEIGIINEGISLINRKPLSPREAPYVARYTLLVPSVDITAIGSGGGSVAWLDGDALKVGPISSGADPGPACYGHGGTKPTVTDADLMLGFLNPDFFLGGRMRVNKVLSEKAIREDVAGPLGIEVIDAARGIYDVVNTQMADFARKVTVERGYDPRDFKLFVYGGAGPVHCGAFGIELGTQEIIIPGSGFAAAHSALGIAISDLKSSAIQTRQLVMPAEPSAILDIFGELEDKVTRTLRNWGVAKENIQFARSVDMRFKRQASTINVPIPKPRNNAAYPQEVCRRFEAKYESLYGKESKHSEAGIEIVNFIVDGFGKQWRPQLRKHTSARRSEPRGAVKSSRNVFFSKHDDFIRTTIYDGSKLKAGMHIGGPSIVEFEGTTAVVHPDMELTIDNYLNLVIRRSR